MIIMETDRLFLRHFHIVDSDAMDRVFGDPEVMRFGGGIKTPEQVRKWLRGCLQDYHELWGFGLWAIVEKMQRQVIGFCGFSRFADVDGQPETEIGYRLARAFWGRVVWQPRLPSPSRITGLARSACRGSSPLSTRRTRLRSAWRQKWAYAVREGNGVPGNAGPHLLHGASGGLLTTPAVERRRRTCGREKQTVLICVHPRLILL